MTLNHISILLLAICVYPQFANAYTTSVTTVAGAGWSGGLGGIGDFDQEGKIDIPSQASTSVIFQQIDQNSPSGYSYQYQALATGSASPGILKAYAGAGAAVGPANANASATSIFDDSFSIVGPGGGLTTVQLTLNYLISGGLNGLSAASGFVSVNGVKTVEFDENWYTPRQYFCAGTACSGSITLDLPVNRSIPLLGYLTVGATATGDIFNPVRSSIADFSNTGLVFLSIADPNYRLITNSGFNYSPVPLPTSLWLFGSALLGWLSRFGIKQKHSNH
ncbi:MAG: hypothetical protein Q8Q40_16350 [Methylococcaceae bacterium]|nr:hypothetical protein [Methylococcaceae bacterium]MDP3905525.1 hypothetical protein [Methylococcaceae bacterium]